MSIPTLSPSHKGAFPGQKVDAPSPPHRVRSGHISSPTKRGEPTPQMLAKSGWMLTAARIEIGAAERATGSERAYTLATAGADMGSVGCHINKQTTCTCAPAHIHLNGV